MNILVDEKSNNGMDLNRLPQVPFSSQSEFIFLLLFVTVFKEPPVSHSGVITTKMKHNKIETPVYIFWVNHRPSLKGKGKTEFMNAVKTSAQSEVSTPIKTDDIEVEIIYSTLENEHERMDIDNVTKPSLDAMKAIVYSDDKQVRSVNARLFDRKKNHTVSGRVEHIGPLFYSNHPHVVLISIYSDSRILELGGEDIIRDARMKKWNKNYDDNSKKL